MPSTVPELQFLKDDFFILRMRVHQFRALLLVESPGKLLGFFPEIKQLVVSQRLDLVFQCEVVRRSIILPHALWTILVCCKLKNNSHLGVQQALKLVSYRQQVNHDICGPPALGRGLEQNDSPNQYVCHSEIILTLTNQCSLATVATVWQRRFVHRKSITPCHSREVSQDGN